MIYIGIDPGSAGGMAAIEGDHIDLSPIGGNTEQDIWAWFEEYTPYLSTGKRDVFACIEQVGGFMGKTKGEEGENRNRASAHTMFSFGQNYGFLRCCLIGNRIPLREVNPREWQAYYKLKKEKGETQSSWKGRLKQRAQQLFPDEKITNATADAILIAEYCRQYKGNMVR